MAYTDTPKNEQRLAAAKERNNKIKAIINQKEPTFLGMSGKNGGQQTYCCPFCTSGRGAHKTGISMIPATKHTKPIYRCFSCQNSSDVFNMAMTYYGTNFTDTMKILINYYNIDVQNLTASEQETQEIQDREEEEEENRIVEIVDQTDFIKTCCQNLDPSYLLKRGISEETQRHFLVGTDLNWINPKNDNTKKYPSPRCIIPSSPYSYLARDIRPNSELTDIQQKYTKIKCGPQHLFNVREAMSRTITPIFVVEGEIDAMSVYEFSRQKARQSGKNFNLPVLGLGSTGNWKQFTEMAKAKMYLENGQKQESDKPVIHRTYVIMMDNDTAGKKAAKNIADTLEAYGIPCYIQKYPSKYNDPNQMWQENPRMFESCIRETINTIKKDRIAAYTQTKNKKDEISDDV